MVQITTNHLLEKIFEFTAMTPDEKEWDVAKLQSNKPRQVRLQRIEAMLTAFGLYERKPKRLFASVTTIRSAIERLLDGDFIGDLDDATLAVLDDYVAKQLDYSYSDRKIASDELQFIYRYLMKYKKQLYKLERFNSGWLEASGNLSQYAIGLTSTITAHLVGKTKELDYLLELIINPNRYTFTEQELIDKYGYPDVDLLDLDLDFM
jgi:hypothetical protein